MVCTKCGKMVDDNDNYCRYCGNYLKGEEELPWYYRSWLIYLGIIFIGPLMLPLIMKNPGMSQKKKVVLTVIIIVYTLLLLVLPAIALNYIYSKVLEGSYY
jgi:hypothetical protein